jgi:sigma-B regulation protein RsbU (phosphoserine phosphatase)
LPLPLKSPIEVDWRFIPSRQLGGDAFGYQWLDETHFMIYLLDVCGHGIGTALLSISIVNLLRSQTLPQADFKNPASVLAALNQAFQMETQNNLFFTLWYGVYHSEGCELIYSSAGHPPAILLTNGDEEDPFPKDLKTSGIAIGVILEAEFENHLCKIKNKSSLYLFSDGVYEITNSSGQILDFKEFKAILSRQVKMTKPDLDDIVKEIQQLKGQELFEDDVSILCIQF